MSLFWRQAGVAVRTLLVMTVVLGVLYPAAVWLVGRAVPAKADGSYVQDAQGQLVGSVLIGQGFDGPQWFHSRPSAAGDGYDAMSSSGSNLGPNNPELLDAVEQAKARIVRRDGVAAGDVPPDAVTASASGLDPHISPEYARLQIGRVARARQLPEAEVAALVEQHVEGRWLGFLGEPQVNVLELNLDLAG